MYRNVMYGSRMTTPTAPTTAPRVGDVVRIRKGTRTSLLEVTYADDLIVSGHIPYASTYDAGGAYEGSYRGTQSAWLTQVVEIVREGTR